MVWRVTDEAARGRQREDSQYWNPIQLIQLQPNMLEVTELISLLQSLDGQTPASLYLDDWSDVGSAINAIMFPQSWHEDHLLPDLSSFKQKTFNFLCAHTA